jgi:hypothetical protein
MEKPKDDEDRETLASRAIPLNYSAQRLSPQTGCLDRGVVAIIGGGFLLVGICIIAMAPALTMHEGSNKSLAVFLLAVTFGLPLIVLGVRLMRRAIKSGCQRNRDE